MSSVLGCHFDTPPPNPRCDEYSPRRSGSHPISACVFRHYVTRSTFLHIAELAFLALYPISKKGTVLHNFFLFYQIRIFKRIILYLIFNCYNDTSHYAFKMTIFSKINWNSRHNFLKLYPHIWYHCCPLSEHIYLPFSSC